MKLKPCKYDRSKAVKEKIVRENYTLTSLSCLLDDISSPDMDKITYRFNYKDHLGTIAELLEERVKIIFDLKDAYAVAEREDIEENQSALRSVK
jgi:hypothetical protein